jgi:YidC/Oxa1 family membrane protein insertase
MNFPLSVFGPLQWLINVLDSVLVWIHDTTGVGWGMSIILLTVLVRALLLPLTLKQFRSMQGMQKIAPEIKALQEKYKDDKQRQQQEMMKLYQEHSVNPFGSCLPLVAQLPVFFSLFYMLRKDLKFDICNQNNELVKYAAQHHQSITSIGCDQVIPGSAKFLFIPDLTAKATGWVLIVLLILYIGSQLLSSVLMSVTADRNQRFIMIALPFVFVPFIQGFPAGLLVYWITTNLWTVGQQYVMRRSAGMPVRGGPMPVPAGAAAAVETPAARPTRRRQKTDDDDGKAPAKSNGKDSEAAARRTTAPPPPPRSRKKKKTGRRR